MPTTPDNPIVLRAINVACAAPGMAPLDVLDEAIKGHEGSRPDFGNHGPLSWLFADHRDPPAPFADLLRRAFAAHLSPYDLLILTLHDNSAVAPAALIDAVRQTWRDQVVAKFMDRYRLFP